MSEDGGAVWPRNIPREKKNNINRIWNLVIPKPDIPEDIANNYKLVKVKIVIFGLEIFIYIY